MPSNPYTSFETQATSLTPGAGGLMLVPYWNNVMNPYWAPVATSITVGWTTAHRQHHLYRAIPEAIAFEYLLGGGSRSDLWCEILADVLGASVRRTRSADATNLGAAVLAAAALGWHASIDTAATAMTTTTDLFEADSENQATYDRLCHDVYLGLFPGIQPLIDRLAELSAAPGLQPS